MWKNITLFFLEIFDASLLNTLLVLSRKMDPLLTPRPDWFTTCQLLYVLGFFSGELGCLTPSPTFVSEDKSTCLAQIQFLVFSISQFIPFQLGHHPDSVMFHSILTSVLLCASRSSQITQRVRGYTQKMEGRPRRQAMQSQAPIMRFCIGAHLIQTHLIPFKHVLRGMSALLCHCILPEIPRVDPNGSQPSLRLRIS
jgi:hypothetical protein